MIGNILTLTPRPAGWCKAICITHLATQLLCTMVLQSRRRVCVPSPWRVYTLRTQGRNRLLPCSSRGEPSVPTLSLLFCNYFYNPTMVCSMYVCVSTLTAHKHSSKEENYGRNKKELYHTYACMFTFCFAIRQCAEKIQASMSTTSTQLYVTNEEPTKLIGTTHGNHMKPVVGQVYVIWSTSSMLYLLPLA